MSELIMLRFAVGFTALCAIVSLGFVCWLMWSMFWDTFDFFMQRHKRRRNNRFTVGKAL